MYDFTNSTCGCRYDTMVVIKIVTTWDYDSSEVLIEMRNWGADKLLPAFRM